MDKFFKTLPFLAAFFIAVFAMPTLVVQVNAKQMGTEHAQPWRAKALTACSRAAIETRAWLTRTFDALWGHPLRGPVLAGAAMLVAAIVAPDQMGHAGLIGVLGNVKLARQNEADLRAELVKVKQERGAIATATLAREAGKRSMTEDENKKFLDLSAKIETLDAQIAEAMTLREAAEASADAERNAAIPSRDADQAAAEASRQAAGLPKHSIQVDDHTKKPGFFGRQLQAVYRFASERGQMENLSASDRDALNLMMPQGGIKAAATGLNTDVGSDGAFLVSQDRSSTIIQRAYSVGEILKRLKPIPISANSNGIVLPAVDETSRADSSRYGGIVSGWLGQGNTLTSGKPKFRPMDMKLRKVGAFVYATDELLADARALEAWINTYLPLELKFRTEDAIINGTGQNQPLGILNSGCVISVTRSSASRILSDDLRSMVNRMWAPLWGNAVFLVDQSTLGEFDLLAVQVGTGGQLDPSYKPAGDGRQYATYKNIPIIPVEYMAALGTSGDIVLTCFTEYALIDKGSVDQAVSLHVAFLTDEQVFRFMYRVDGQCTWNSALTPKSGGNTLSCTLKLS